MGKKGNSAVRFISFLYDHTEGFLLILLTFLLVTDIFLGILSRYIHFNVVFATELGKYIFIWLCAIGISAAAKDNQHVRIYYLVLKIPVNPRITWIFTQALFLVFTVFFFIWGIRLTWMHFIMDKEAVGFRFPMFIFTAALPVGFALTSSRLLQNIIGTLKDPDKNVIWDSPPQEGITDITGELPDGEKHDSI